MLIRIQLYLLLFVLTFLAVARSYGQTEPILTQYMFNMQYVNPAYAGMWEKIGFNSLVRKQWAGFDRSPLTQVISFHTPTKNENVGLGLNVSATGSGMKTSSAFLAITPMRLHSPRKPGCAWG